MTSTRENVSDMGLVPGLCLGPRARPRVRSKRGAVHIPNRSVAERREVGSRVRLREPLAPDIALGRASQIAALLRFRLMREMRVGKMDQRNGERRRPRRVRPGHLIGDDDR